MENVFTPSQGIIGLALYGVVMISLALWSRRNHTQDKIEFLLAGRNVGILFGAMSAAVSWVWAPALFVGAQKAYEQGIAGLFAFCFPNFLALIIFSIIALKARKIFPQGFTLPQLMKDKYDGKVHKLYLTQFLGLQTVSFSIQLLAGSTLISLLTGLSFSMVGVGLVVIALSYSLIGGLRASIITDLLQMTLILGVIIAVIPSSINSAGGFEAVIGGLSGVSGIGGNILDPWILYSFGIPVAIALITGPVSDQMQWQRAYALGSDKNVVKTFILAACLFILVPLSLSTLGFIAANPDVSAAWNITSAQMVGPIAVSNLLPDIMLLAFSVMLLSGLTSTLDSILCAVSSLVAVDVFNEHDGESNRNGRNVLIARLGMLGVAIVGLSMALIPEIKIIHLWFFATTFRAPSFIPTILTMFWKPMKSNVVFWSILLAFLIGGPTYVIGTIIGNPHMVVAGSVLPIIISTSICLLWSRIKTTNPNIIKTFIKA